MIRILVLLSFSVISFIGLSQSICNEMGGDYSGECYSYFDNGDTSGIYIYENGYPVSGVVYRQDGGIKEEFSDLAQDELTIKRTTFYPSGDTSLYMELKNGNGVYTEYHSSGVVMIHGDLENGLPSGTWFGYNSEGRKRVEMVCDSSLNHGGEMDFNIALMMIMWNASRIKTEIETNRNNNDLIRLDPYGVIESEEVPHVKEETVFVDEISDVPEPVELTVVEEEIVEFPDVEPEFPGGKEKMAEYINQNIMYPEISIENQIEGKVYLGFIVEKDGSISNIKVLRGADPDLDREAKRVLRNMPKWKPGMYNGKIVRVRMILPIVFDLAEPELKD